MAQILRFFAWIAWGVVTTVIFVGVVANLVFEGPQSLSGVTSDPTSIIIVLVAYLPGGVFYLMGYLVEWLKKRENTASEAGAKEVADPTDTPTDAS